jgi:hypothetical protein
MMTFLEIVLRADESMSDSRDEIEDTLTEALEQAGVGEITGGGSGLDLSNLDVEVSGIEQGLSVIRHVLRELRVGPSTVIKQYRPVQVTHRVYE